MKKSTENKIWECFDREQYPQARKILKSHLRRNKADYWALGMISSTYYEERKYQKAIEWSDRAMAIEATDPYILWLRAAPLEQVGRRTEAIEIWQQLIDAGAEKVGTEWCKEGLRWAKSLINDCRYRLALAYWELGKKDLFTQYLLEHKAHRKGLKSIYSKKEVETYLQKIAA